MMRKFYVHFRYIFSIRHRHSPLIENDAESIKSKDYKHRTHKSSSCNAGVTLYTYNVLHFSERCYTMLPSYEHKLTEIREMISSLLYDILLSSQQSLKAFENNDTDLYASVRSKINTVKAITDTIDTKIIQTIALFGPEANELRDLIVYLKMTNEIDRIVDSIDKYCKRFNNHIFEEYNLTSFNNAIIQLHKTTLHTLEYLYAFFMDIDHASAHDLYRKVLIEESINDDLFSIIEKDFLSLIMTHSEHSTEYVNVLGTLRNLERIADRAVSIAALLLYAQNGGELQLRR